MIKDANLIKEIMSDGHWYTFDELVKQTWWSRRKIAECLTDLQDSGYTLQSRPFTQGHREYKLETIQPTPLTEEEYAQIHPKAEHPKP